MKLILKKISSWTRIGRWSKLRVARLRRSESNAMPGMAHTLTFIGGRWEIEVEYFDYIIIGMVCIINYMLIICNV